MRPSGIGGMAVMEGVMMKNKEEYAVAVRKPNNEIAVEKCTHKDFSDRVKLFKLPIFRGILAFVDSLVVGMKVLNYSASFFEDEEDESQKKKKEKSEKKSKKNNTDFEFEEVSVTHKGSDNLKHTETKEKENIESKKDDKSNALLMVFAVLLSIVISVALFMVLPVFLTNLLTNVVKNKILMNLIEGFVRLAIFIGYVLLAAKMPEIKRVFMYHGAEHKSINCLEHGYELTVENVRRQSKQHKRCGTSFMLLVILISLIFFLFIPTGNLLWKVLSRILLVPFIAGVSYEFIRLAGRTENKVVNALSKPGLWMQGLTTKEPDDTMIEVAIASVEAVFDWRTFLENSKETKADQKKNVRKSSDTVKNMSNEKPAKVEKPAREEKPASEVKDAGQGKPAKEGKQASEVKAAGQGKPAKEGKHISEDKPAAQGRPSKEEKQVNEEKQSKNVKPVKEEKTDNGKKQGSNIRPVDSTRHENQKKSNTLNNTRVTPIKEKPSKEDEEDDEILKALDKFFDNGAPESKKAAEGK